MKTNFDKKNIRLGTYSTQWDYIKDRFGESELLPFSISDTDFEVPSVITKKLHEVVDHAIFGYTRWDHNDFKQSISNHFHQRWKCRIEDNWVVYSPSVLYSIAALIKELSKDEDGILVFDPMYDAFINVIEKNNRKLNKIALNYEESLSFNIDEFETKLKQSKILLLCSPHNPTGKVFSKKEITDIIALCQKHDVWIISDEIHADITLFNNRHIPLLTYYKSYKKLIIVSSASKVFNTPGLGGSYAIIPNQEVQMSFRRQTREKDFVNSANIMGMHAMITGYNEANDYIDDLVQYIESNVRIVKGYFETHMPYIRYSIPQSTYLAWIDVRHLDVSAEEIQEALIHHGKVAIMNGATYGANGEKFLRMNIGCPKEKLMLGLEGMKKAFDLLLKGGENNVE